MSNVKNRDTSTKFISTRQMFSHNTYKELSFVEAVFQGLAPDGGLYFPTSYSNLRELFYSYDANTSFLEIASSMTHALFGDEFSAEEAEALCASAFNFSPKLHSIDAQIDLLELFHGPSCAFKDFGASYLAAIIEKNVQEAHKNITILTATSGDTGSAVAQAFYQKKGVRVVILYPSKRVSPLQERQLTCLGGNIHALEIDGSFDDCQQLVKTAFQDEDVRHELGLSSANSINIGRLIPQSFYYVYAWNILHHMGQEDFIFCVPSGNFGNLSAGLLATQWGLPISHMFAVTNANDVFPSYMETGVYHAQKSRETLANAMDVGNPSNFERMQTMCTINAIQSGADASGDDLAQYVHQEFMKILKSQSVSDEEIREEIQRVYDAQQEFICPHTATGTFASRHLLQSDWAKAHHYKKAVVLSTAEPAKFHEVIEDITARQVNIPNRLAKFFDMDSYARKIPADFEKFREILHEICTK